MRQLRCLGWVLANGFKLRYHSKETELLTIDPLTPKPL